MSGPASAALDARNLGARWPAPHPHWCARRSAQALNRDGGGSAQRPMGDKRTCSTVSGMDAVDRARGWLRVPAGDLLIAGGTAALATADTLSRDHNEGPVEVYTPTGVFAATPHPSV